MHGTPQTSHNLTARLGALEIGAALQAPGDGTLEADGLTAGPNPMGPPGFPARTQVVFGHCNPIVDDAALEAASEQLGPTVQCPPITPRSITPGCRLVDDANLEATSAGLGGGPTSSSGGCRPVTVIPCRRDDGALELLGSQLTNAPSEMCTGPLQCPRRLDDDR